MRYFLIAAPAFLLVSACSGEGASENEPAGAASGEVSDIAEAYRTSFERAWQSASEGRSPSQACAGVVGKAVGLLKTTATGGQDRADALAALDACYVRAMAHFVDTTLSVDKHSALAC